MTAFNSRGNSTIKTPSWVVIGNPKARAPRVFRDPNVQHGQSVFSDLVLKSTLCLCGVTRVGLNANMR